MKSRKIKCPQCGKEFEVDESCDRPFCSSRCKLIDLGNWLDESYTIPTQGEESEQ